jgi:two-component system, sensor histidine kinase and response regulator
VVQQPNTGDLQGGAPSGPVRRVLVIDDEQRMANSIRSLLAGSGYVVDVAYGGREGLRKLSEEDYQVCITDLRMNDLDGFDVMRSIGNRRTIAFIVITGHASTESAIEALHHECFDYITKPFDYDVLRGSVQRAFEKVEAVRFRDDMISMITHDIKIPLSSIIGYGSLIFDKETGQLNPRAKEFVQAINSNGVKILSLIDNFLTSCKIEAGKLSLFPRDVNINYLIEDLLCLFHVDLERNQQALRTDLDANLPAVVGDETLLFRAVSNVISNACKFTPQHGEITLRTARCAACESPLEEDCVLIEVSNSGPGILPEDLPRIFEKYRRSRNHRGIEGSGIGSYVLRYIVEAHGGRVMLHSVPNSLTSFRIFLPIAHMSNRGEALQQ